MAVVSSYLKRSVKSDNERDLISIYRPVSPEAAHYGGAGVKPEEGEGNDGSVAPNVLGYTRATKDRQWEARPRGRAKPFIVGLRAVTHPHEAGFRSNRVSI